MGSAEVAGDNWRAIPGFITPEQAQSANTEAKILKSNALPYVKEFKPMQLSKSRQDSGLTVLRMILGHMSPTDKREFSALLTVFEAMKEIGSRNDDAAELLLNFYSPGASTGDHKDSYSPRTMTTGLSGSAVLHIQDPVSGEWHEPPIMLRTTDALYIDNSVPVEQRPIHRVENARDLPRIAIVGQFK